MSGEPRETPASASLRVLRHDVVDSTNECAHAALEAGEARDGDVHVARGQTRGRGRLGRRWESPPGEGLYVSLVHLPPPPGPHAPAVTMAAGLALLDLLLGLGVERARLDWPNDVVAGGAKLAGVLVESRGFVPERPHFVIGVGLNVRQSSFPEELLSARAVTSLHLLGIQTEPERLVTPLAERLLDRLRMASDRSEELCADYLEATGLGGVEVLASSAQGTIRGRLEGLELARGLCFRVPTGAPRWIELAHVRSIERARSL